MKQTTAVRIFFVGLPVGLILGTVIAFFLPSTDLSGNEKKDKRDSLPKKISEITPQLIDKHIKVFNGVGERDDEKIIELKSAAAYIESSLGRLNLGYNPERLPANKSAAPIISIHRKGDSNDYIIVFADYSQPTVAEAERPIGTAALMALAGDLWADEAGATVHFLALPNREEIKMYLGRARDERTDKRSRWRTNKIAFALDLSHFAEEYSVAEKLPATAEKFIQTINLPTKILSSTTDYDVDFPVFRLLAAKEYFTDTEEITKHLKVISRGIRNIDF